MRLYSRTNAGAIDDPEFGHFDADEEHGGFDLPDELSDRMHRFHPGGRTAWETEDERAQRLHGDEQARRRDPETLYNAVEQIASITAQLAGLQLAAAGGAQPDPEPEAPPAKAPRKAAAKA